MDGLLGFVGAVWLLRGADLLVGTLFLLPRLKPAPASAALFPKISVLFASRDEGEKVRAAVLTMLDQDYPDFEVIAVDDRSGPQDAAVIRSLSHPRLKTVRVDELPAGWLGKTHALHRGFARASGEWLLFTDADVHFTPDAFRAAMAASLGRNLDHLTLFPELELKKYVEGVFTNFFALQFNQRYRPWMARFRFAPAYAGIGAFSLIRRSAYEKIGGHRKVALDIADDMMLGKALKRSGARQMLMAGGPFVRVRWVAGFKGVLASLHKNAFRGLEYSVLMLLAATGYIFVFDILPFAALAAGIWTAPVFVSIGVIAVLYLAAQRFNRLAAASFPAHPFAALLFLFILWRSAAAALRDGGVSWRGTFYPLKDLKKARV
jgi:glycosyltransferase involved in cell wall biosynthesis